MDNYENLSIRFLQEKNYLMSLFLLEGKNWASVVLILLKIFLIKIPKYSVLNTYKTVQSFNVKTFGWKASLKYFLLNVCI